MAINVSARIAQVLIGGEDWSGCLLEASNWETTSLDQSGLIRTTAQLQLIPTRNQSGSLDDRKNLATWKVGNPIQLSISSQSGTLQPHPAGRLRLLSTQYNPEDGRLTVQAGCLITLMNFRQPTKSDEADINIESFTPRRSLVEKLLTLAGINAYLIPNLPYPINYPLNIGSSYLETVGRLLYSAGYVGWIDGTETFRVKPVALTPGSTLSLQIGTDKGDELWYRRLPGSEGPRENIKVNGVRPTAKPPVYPKISTITRYGTAAMISEELGTGTIVASKEIVTEEFGGNVLTTKTSIYTPLGLAIPEFADNYVFPSGLMHSDFKVEEKTFESGKDGKIVKIVTDIYKVQGAVLLEYILFKEQTSGYEYATKTGLFLAEKIISIYSYDGKQRPTRIETTKFESIGALLAGHDYDWGSTVFASSLKLAEESVESWTRERGNKWIHTINTNRTLGRVKPEAIAAYIEYVSLKNPSISPDLLNEKLRNRILALVPDLQVSVRETSNSGQTVPPAPERRPAKMSYEDEQVCGHAVFAQVGGNPYKERERVYQAEYLAGRVASPDEDTIDYSTTPPEPSCTDTQCEAIAQIEGKLLFGRHKGQDIGISLKDELFNWEPLMPVRCSEPDGTVRFFAMDDCHWFLGNNRAMCNFGAIWLGDAAIAGGGADGGAGGAGSPTTLVITAK